MTVHALPTYADLGISGENALRDIVAFSLDVPSVDHVELSIDEVPYDLVALTTRGRYRVHGAAQVDGETRPVSLFVKVLQSWTLTDVFQQVPPEAREIASAGLPWQVEPLAYESSLTDAMPPGLRMPACYAVKDLGPLAAAVWMEYVVERPAPWDQARYASTARLLGRFASRPAVAEAIIPLADAVASATVRDYVNGRVRFQLMPIIRGDEVWQHPLVEHYFGALRRPLRQLVDDLPSLAAELTDSSSGVCHGDACTRNLLCAGPGETVMIDYGFLRPAPLGLDLAQLAFGAIQLGERGTEDVGELWSACVDGYLGGVHDEGRVRSHGDLRRAATVSAAIFSVVSAIPIDHLGADDSPTLRRLFDNRAVVARFILDELAV